MFVVAQPLSLPLWDPRDCSKPGSSILHCLPEFAQIHVHWGSDANISFFATLFLFAFPSGKDFPGSSDGKVPAYSAGNLGLIPGLGRSPGEGNGNPLQYSCLENPMDGRDW